MAAMVGCGQERSSEASRDRVASGCRDAVVFKDSTRDSRSWVTPAPADRKPAPPSGDLTQLAVGATSSGLCVSFTTAAPIESRSELSFIARGPFIQGAGGGMTAFGYGFQALVGPEHTTLTYGLAAGGGRRPNVVKGQVDRGGNVVTIRVAKRELDRAPGNMPGRPPFPFRQFTLEARVMTPRAPSGAQEVDFLPNERTGALGITDGRASD